MKSKRGNYAGNVIDGPWKGRRIAHEWPDFVARILELPPRPVWDGWDDMPAIVCTNDTFYRFVNGEWTSEVSK